jgi:hypothetical protein
LRTRLANASKWAARAAPAASQALEGKGENFPDSLHFSESDRTLLKVFIAQLWMVIQHKPASFPDQRWMMLSAFNTLKGVALRDILPHVQEDETISLDDPPGSIQLVEAAFGDPD